MEVGPVPQVEILLLWCWLSQHRTLDQHFRHTPQGFHKEQCTPLRQSKALGAGTAAGVACPVAPENPGQEGSPIYHGTSRGPRRAGLHSLSFFSFQKEKRRPKVPSHRKAGSATNSQGYFRACHRDSGVTAHIHLTSGKMTDEPLRVDTDTIYVRKLRIKRD